jgi:hypothetical protein
VRSIAAAVLLGGTLALASVPACAGPASPVNWGPVGKCAGRVMWPIGRRSQQPISWIVPLSFLRHFGGVKALLMARAFDNGHTYVYGTQPSTIGVPTAAYSSYEQIQAAFWAGTLPGKYRAVIYDNERWPYTPLTEQRHPVYYERLAAGLLHRHGLVYIATPAPDLMWATGRPRDSYAAYLRSDVAGHAARYADVVDIQGQTRETDLREFVCFVAAAVRQVRSANPRAKVLIGLRTNPGDRGLAAAYAAVAGLADGYWLNVNGRPGVARYLLGRIYGASA